MQVDAQQLLPEDHEQALLIGRVWIPATAQYSAGPALVRVTAAQVYDLTPALPTLADLINHVDPVSMLVATGCVNPLARFDDIAAHTLAGSGGDHGRPFFISPIDLQPVKACGVTFHDSLVERVIEERARGDRQLALRLREEIVAETGTDFNEIVPGSREALDLLALLKRKNLWSQYLEVGLGVDVEIFTKAAPLASVGTGAEIGVLPASAWNNPEPELTLVINRRAEIIAATLGNDVNHRDIEGRSALLLGKAKDNNAGCALGPFLRLLDSNFTLEDMRKLEVTLSVDGEDGFRLEERNTMTSIRRDPEDLVAQCIGPCNDFPDGVALMLGAMCAPTHDRGEPGAGFTHKPGDIVRIASPRLGTLVNRVQYSDRLGARRSGLRELMAYLSQRGLV